MVGITMHILFCFKRKVGYHWNMKDCGSKGYNYGIGNDIIMLLHRCYMDSKAAIIEVFWAYKLSFI
jgi:hypothetical protein